MSAQRPHKRHTRMHECIHTPEHTSRTGARGLLNYECMFTGMYACVHICIIIFHLLITLYYTVHTLTCHSGCVCMLSGNSGCDIGVQSASRIMRCYGETEGCQGNGVLTDIGCTSNYTRQTINQPNKYNMYIYILKELTPSLPY